MDLTRNDAWTAGRSYDAYMGRWRARIAQRFVRWLDPAPDLDWIEFGCGTGALTHAVAEAARPRALLATDPAEPFVEHLRTRFGDGPVRATVADARSIPSGDGSADLVVSALALNFVPEPAVALGEARRLLRPGGRAAGYVWDSATGGVGFIDMFWRAAGEIDPDARDMNEARRFADVSPDRLLSWLAEAGLEDAVVEEIEIETPFDSFEDLWTPFTLGVGPAPGYCASLPEMERARLRTGLGRRFEETGGALRARALAFSATRPDGAAR